MKDKKLRKRFNTALKRLNLIARSVLVGQRKSSNNKPPDVPFMGFGFIRKFSSIQTGRPAIMTIRAKLSGSLEPNQKVNVISDNPEVKVLTPQLELIPRKDFPEIGEARISIEGRQVGAETLITARTNGLSAQAQVKVTSKHIVEEEKSARSFISDIEFSPTADPRQRVVYDRDAAKIIIATRAPSVRAYLGEEGAGANTPQGQVLLAELVTEVLCQEIARVGVHTGKLPAFHDSIEATIQAHFTRLQHEFAHEIHAYFVDSKYRRLPEEATED
ncbi:MAG: hypothetical protein FVQ83_15235 [Chloroflexi bacterium]|nr:hypothetical protein [Chloroflexota bacterium]